MEPKPGPKPKPAATKATRPVKYEMKAMRSLRDDIKKTPEQECHVMPNPGTLLLVGATGSGKSTIVANLLTQSGMLRNYFDEVYLFCLSPATTLIDNVPQLKEKNMFIKDDPTPLVRLFDQQKAAIKAVGFKRAKHILFILDDIVQSNRFMKSEVLTDLFFGGSHSKASTWICSQNYMSVPRRLRMNALGIILCHGVNQTEIDRFGEEWQNCFINKRKFIELVKFALKKKYSFLFANACCPDKRLMYRSGFDTILEIQDSAEPQPPQPPQRVGRSKARRESPAAQ